MNPFLIVFSDLDGTLLDHETYGYDAAGPALEALRSEGIPLVLCSSKTAAEVASLRETLGFSDCAAIVENGAGILQARAAVPAPALTHTRLMQIVDGLPLSLRERFSGFSDWTPAELQANTGLGPDDAARAAMRDYSEPGLWLGDDDSRREFIGELDRHGVRVQQGGRFLTLGFAASKADRMEEVMARYRSQQSATVTSIALGDAPNDVEMLESADIGIIIPNPAHDGIQALAGESTGSIIRAGEAGPAGWNSSLLALLDNRGPATGAS